MEMAITTMSSKGQIVIPSELRKNYNEGDKLILIQTKDQLIIKKVKDLSKNFEEDLKFAKRTEAALKKFENKRIKRNLDFDEFLEEMKSW